MRKIVLFVMICCQAFCGMAQKKAPKWMNKEREAVIMVTTYGENGQQIAQGLGFFVTETGEAVSGYALFQDARKAIVTDIDGQQYPVSRILGADELYDVIRFKVDSPRKTRFLSVAEGTVPQGSTVYLMPYSKDKITRFGAGTVTEISKVKGDYGYYKLSMPLEEGWVNAPILTEEGEVFGLAQADASGKKEISYGMSVGYANSLAIRSADIVNTTYSSIGIRKAWPRDESDARVALLLLAGWQDAKSYLATLNDFIATFPESPDGYLSRASHYAFHRTDLASAGEEPSVFLDKALEDIDSASRLTDKEGDVWYNRAKLIFGVATADTTLNDENWTLAAAEEAIRKAIEEEDSPLYRQLEGDIFFSEGKFERAFDDYMKVNLSDVASSSSWYLAAKAKQNTPGANLGDIIALLDSAVARCGNPPSREAAPYILERVDFKLKLMLYKEAVADYDLYYKVLDGQVNDGFYYYREQAKFRMGDFAGALADIQSAIRLNPRDPVYQAEEASVYIRMEDYERALESVEKALSVAPDFASCYRLRGICYVHQEEKAEACEAFQKAKELGDPIVDKLIRQHCQ